jgi:hypothetical protein
MVLAGTPTVQRDAAIHLEEGTTAELEGELTRLQRERASLSAAQQPSYDTPISRLQNLLRERIDTGLAECDVSLSFDGRTLSMFAPRSASYPAVSGRPMPDGTFDYSRERQHRQGEGPIPAGSYWLDPRQMTDLRWHLLVSGASWGTHRITIHPYADTATFGRGGFFVHGGSTPGSAGCIDLTSNMAAFAEALARNVTSACRVRLVVSYPEAAPDTGPVSDSRMA